MKKFLNIPISPLMGSTLSNFIHVISKYSISTSYILNVFLTFLVIVITSPFQLIDKVIFFLKKDTKKKDPIFIIGHWRSGTTFLQNLLCQDKKFGYFNTYNSLFISNIYSSMLFKTLMKITMPKTRPSDGVKLGVELPQEDEFALTNYTILSHYLFFFFPNDYKKIYNNTLRLVENDQNKWLKYYDNIISRISIYTGKERILIKNPSNTSRIKYLLKQYPNAKFIHIYRNPVFVYLSTFKFFSELFPSVNLQNFDEDKLVKLVIYNYREIYKDYYKYKDLIPKNNLIEFGFEDFKKDPLAQIERVYENFDLDGLEVNRDAFKKYIKSQEGHKINQYKIKKELLKSIKKEFKQSFKEMNYEIPKNLKIIN